MTDTPRCPKCGTPLPGDATAGCPRCLLAAGLGSGADSPQSPPTAPSPAEMGKHFPQFEILELLGQGGMGIVYRAKQRSLDRLVALKVMPPDAARDSGFADRFSREARTLARLQHPNIVGVHDFGVSDGLYYLVMEYVDGANLREAMRTGKLSAREALAVVPQICDALQYAHDQGVVHRDIKPENILLDRAGRVRIADFGLAKIVQRTPLEMTLTRQGQVMGTLHYMAPEQYRTPDSVDHRADIYSLGVVFYEMLTGELPLGSFPPPSDKAGVDARLDGVVLRALERERDRRWQKASELKDRVSAISSAGFVGGAGAPGAAAAAAPAAPTTPAAPESKAERKAREEREKEEEDKAWWKEGDVEAPLSRLAVVGGLSLPASALAGFLVWGIARLFGAGPFTAASVGWVLFLLGAFTGWICACVAWYTIRHAGGRLRGVPWAAAGALIPPSMICWGPCLFSLTPPIGISRGPDGKSVDMPFLSVEEKNGKTRVRMPFLDVQTDRDGNDVTVTGGPPSIDRADVRREIEAAWKAHPLGTLDSDADLFAVRISGDGLTGRAVFSDGETTLSTGIRIEKGRWTFDATSSQESSSGPPKEEFRDGWLFDGSTPTEITLGGKAPPPTEEEDASRVHGGPIGRSAAEKAVVARGIRELWAAKGPEFVRRPVKVRIGAEEATWTAGGQASDYALFAVALEEDGLRGRAVFTTGKSTIAIGVTRVDGAWRMNENDWEQRFGPATKQDEDGRLYGMSWSPGAPPATADVGSDLASLVTGGPTSWTTADRARMAATLQKAWDAGRESVWSPAITKLWRAIRPEVLAEPPPMRLYGARFDESGRSARGVFTDGETATFAVPFRIAAQNGSDRWLLETEGAEYRFTPPRPDDRDGRLSDSHGDSFEADACLVHGLPAGSSVKDLAAIARELRTLWKEKGPALFEDHANHLKADAGGASIDLCLPDKFAEFRLHAVALAEDGRAGRAVWTNPKNTLSLKITKVGDRWTLHADDAEWRGGPATRDDEDGRLRR